MNVETHAAIGRAISRYLHLDSRLERRLVRGLKKPDLSARRRRRRFRVHHGIHPDSIMDVIWSARRAYLAGDFEGALEALGIALHYVQDKCVVEARRELREIHNRVEREMASLEIPVDAIREGFEKAECSPLFVRAALYSIEPSANPAEALRSACLYSAMIAGAVYNPSQPPREVLEKMLERFKREKAKRKRIAWISAALLATGDLALIFIQPLIFAIFATLLLPFAVLVHILPLLIAYSYRDDPQYEQLAWYGLVQR